MNIPESVIEGARYDFRQKFNSLESEYAEVDIAYKIYQRRKQAAKGAVNSLRELAKWLNSLYLDDYDYEKELEYKIARLVQFDD